MERLSEMLLEVAVVAVEELHPRRVARGKPVASNS